MQGRNRDTDTENGCVDTEGEGEGGTNWESSSLLLSEVVKANRPAHLPTQVLTKCSKSFRNGRENIHDDMRFQACDKVHVVLGEDFQ